MKGVMVYKGKIIRIERMKSSVNGNPRYSITVGNLGTSNTVTACTMPDSFIGYSVQNIREGDRVEMTTSIHRNRLQIADIEKV